MILLLSDPQVNLIFIGENNFKKIHFFKIYADFEGGKEKANSIIGNKTTNSYEQNPVLNGYHRESEVEDVLQSSCYINVDCFVEEFRKLEKKWPSILKTLRTISL